MRYFLSLGSNLGRRAAHLADARARLAGRGAKILRASSLYRTEPVDVLDQPWFLNQVVEVVTDLAPAGLLAVARSIEKEMKRVRTVSRGPRTIDIDILLAGRSVVKSRLLKIPHPRLARRNFALIPLAEIAPRAVHPVLHKTIRVLARESGDRSLVIPVLGHESPRY